MSNAAIIRAALIVLGILLTVYIVFIGLDTIITLLLAVIIASAVRPLVIRLTRWRIPHNVAVLLVYVFVVAFIGGLLLLLIPPIINQLAAYLDNENRLANQVIRIQFWINQQVMAITGGSGLQFAPADEIRATITRLVGEIRAAAPDFIDDLGGVLAKGALIFLMGVYWLTARNELVTFLGNLFPSRHRGQVESIIGEIETTMGSYVRGAVSVALFVGLANFAILLLFNVPNAGVYGFIIGLTTLLPVIGGFIGGLGSAGLAALNTPLHGLIVLGSFVVVQQIESNVLTPRVMAQSAGVNPLLVIVSVLIGYTLGGALGAILSIPLLGITAVLVKRLVIEPHRAAIAPVVDRDGAVLIDTGTPPPIASVPAILTPET